MLSCSDNPTGYRGQERRVTMAAQPLWESTHLLLNEINSESICLDNIKCLIRDKGVPAEEGCVRSALWSILLNIIPRQRSIWSTHLAEKQLEYSKFCDDFNIDPDSEESGPPDASDHPLSTSSSSRWKQYFEDKEMKEQIDRDVDRTHPDLNFFSGDFGGMSHRAKMSRSLFIFYKLNPGIRYVQGMNEIYAVIYYVLGSAKSKSSVDEGLLEALHGDPEVLAFFGFVNIMSEFRDNFCLQLDKSKLGISGMMNRISQLLRGFDAVLWKHLEETLQLSPQLYAFRWVTTLFTQEFVLPDLVAIWDQMIAEDGSRRDFVLRFSAAMILLQRDTLLKSDFSGAIKLLQNYPVSEVSNIIRYSLQLKDYRRIIVMDDDD